MMTSTSNPPTNFSISTARLNITYFDPTSPSHSAFLAHLWNTPDFIASNGKTSITDSHSAQTFIQTRIIPQYTRKGFGLLLVNLRPTSNSPHQNTLPIGTISLMQGDPPNCYSAPDVGFAILPEHQGRGYATEAAKAAISYVQREWNVQGVFGFCAPDNMRSRRVLEKSGLEFRGVRKLRVFGGRESAVFALVGMEEDLGVYGIDT